MRSEVAQRQFGFQFPVVSCGATYAPKRVWGFAKVEDDGSAHFRVPAHVPLYFLPLDAEGRAVQRMRTFTHFMPGERQSCVGCHADRNYASPAGVVNRRPLAAGRDAEDLTEPSWGNRDGFSFPRVVQPVLDRHCVSCHDDSSALDLSGDRTDYFNIAYENLARRGTQAEHGGDAQGGMAGFGRNPYTSWIPTFNGCESNILEIQPKTWGSPVSRLAEVLISGHPDDKGRPRIKLSADEQLRMLMWIDLNVPYYGTSQSRQPELRGCRQILPPDLDKVLSEIGTRRGIELPRTFHVRLDHPEKNPFLAIPLAKGDFASTDDPDYQRILGCFAGVPEALEKRIDVDYRKVLLDADELRCVR
jgi:Hydrazine synthase alpha subunit middle domain